MTLREISDSTEIIRDPTIIKGPGVFNLAAPTNVQYPEEFPTHLAANYITRCRHDQGQFSEPIMYRNLYMEFIQTPADQRFRWMEQNCVAASRMNQMAALVNELAANIAKIEKMLNA